MDRVWHIMSNVPVNATYTLQHNRITNGTAFVDERAEISQYSGSSNWIGGHTILDGLGISAMSRGGGGVSAHTRANITLSTEFLANQTWFTKITPAADVPPRAALDFATGTSCDPIQVNVLENDRPGSSGILVNSITIVEQPRFGTVVVNIDGSITYTANSGFIGEDYLVYEITDEAGQKSQARVNITVLECGFKIPNVFTPDGDGINDFFEIVGLNSFDRVEVLITNRWGNEVYRNDNYKNNWSGQNLHEGVYYYQVTTHKAGQQKQYVSWVLLKRNR